MKKLRDYVLRVLMIFPWAFMLSCGVNAQQNGYKDHSEFLMLWGVVMIAVSLAGFWETMKFAATLFAEDSVRAAELPRQRGKE